MADQEKKWWRGSKPTQAESCRHESLQQWHDRFNRLGNLYSCAECRWWRAGWQDPHKGTCFAMPETHARLSSDRACRIGESERAYRELQGEAPW